MRIPLVKFVGECGLLPWWGRIAWWRPRDHTAVVLPIGVHWLARQFHSLWAWTYRYRGNRWETALLSAYADGDIHGYRSGYERARNVLRRTLKLEGKDDFLLDKLLPPRPALFHRKETAP